MVAEPRREGECKGCAKKYDDARPLVCHSTLGFSARVVTESETSKQTYKANASRRLKAKHAFRSEGLGVVENPDLFRCFAPTVLTCITIWDTA
jgi:hypothetical protein